MPFWLSLSKAALFLGFGACLGLFLGLAYSSHLYGSQVLINAIQHAVAGASLSDSATASELEDRIKESAVLLIPRLAVCVGFGIAASILAGSIGLKVLLQGLKSSKKAESADKATGTDDTSTEPDDTSTEIPERN